MKSKALPLQLWKTKGTCSVLDVSPWFVVQKDVIELPSGKIIEDYYRIECPDYAIVCAQLPDGRVLMERSYKPCVQRFVVTSPAGGIEPDESPLHAAQRELLEETGFTSTEWSSAGVFTVDGTRGLCRAHFFNAKNVRKTAEPQNTEMEQCEILLLDHEQVRQYIEGGEICLLPDIAILNLLRINSK